jgi:hypothetical protein
MWQPDTWPIVYAIASSAKPARRRPERAHDVEADDRGAGPDDHEHRVPMNSAAKIRTSETAEVGGSLRARSWTLLSEFATAFRRLRRVIAATSVLRPEYPVRPAARMSHPNGDAGHRDRALNQSPAACVAPEREDADERRTATEDLLRRLALHDRTAMHPFSARRWRTSTVAS